MSISFENTEIPYIVDFIIEPNLYEGFVDEINSHKAIVTNFK